MNYHPSQNQLAVLVVPGVGGAGKNGINISLKNCLRAFVHCFVQKGADATQTTWTLAQSSGNAGSAAGTGEKALTNTVPIWYSADMTTSNLMTSTTAAKSYQQAITQNVCQHVVFDVIPEQCMDIANGFDCLVVNASDPAAANIAFAFVILEPRYASLPTVYAD